MAGIGIADKTVTNLVNRITFTALFRTASEIADLGLIDAADKLTEQVAASAELAGFSVEELFAPLWGTARDVVGIRRGAISGNMKVSFQAARSIG
jgi:hypothetical protein